MRQKLLFYIDASVSSRFSSFILESQSHISSQNRGEMQGLLERNQCLEQPFCYARRNWGKSSNTCSILWLGLLWAKDEYNQLLVHTRFTQGLDGFAVPHPPLDELRYFVPFVSFCSVRMGMGRRDTTVVILTWDRDSNGDGFMDFHFLK